MRRKKLALLLVATFLSFGAALFGACEGNNGDVGGGEVSIVEEEKSITLSAESVTLPVYGTQTLSATTKGISGQLTWTSENTGVVMVENGVLTPVAPGQTVITVSADGESAQVTVNVIAPVVEVTYASLKIGMGSTRNVGAVCYLGDEELDEAVIEYESENAEVATVDQSGNVTAVSIGETTIKVKAVIENYSFETEVNVTVKEDVSLTADVQQIVLKPEGRPGEYPTEKVIDLTVMLNGKEVVDPEIAVTFSVEGIAAYADGKLTPIGCGETVATFEFVSEKGTKDTCSVEITVMFDKETTAISDLAYFALNKGVALTDLGITFIEGEKIIKVEESDDTSLPFTVSEGKLRLLDGNNVGEESVLKIETSEKIYKYEKAFVVSHMIETIEDLTALGADFQAATSGNILSSGGDFSPYYRDMNDTTNMYVLLMNDIDFQDANFTEVTGFGVNAVETEEGTSLSVFNGTFDGNQHALKNFTTDTGFISNVYNATIKNLILENATTTIYGGILGNSCGKTTVENVYISGTPYIDPGKLGGLYGSISQNSVIKNVLLYLKNGDGDVLCGSFNNINDGGGAQVIDTIVISSLTANQTGTALYTSFDAMLSDFGENIPENWQSVISKDGLYVTFLGYRIYSTEKISITSTCNNNLSLKTGGSIDLGIQVVQNGTEILNPDILVSMTAEDIVQYENGTLLALSAGEVTVTLTYQGETMSENIRFVIRVEDKTITQTEATCEYIANGKTFTLSDLGIVDDVASIVKIKINKTEISSELWSYDVTKKELTMKISEGGENLSLEVESDTTIYQTVVTAVTHILSVKADVDSLHEEYNSVNEGAAGWTDKKTSGWYVILTADIDLEGADYGVGLLGKDVALENQYNVATSFNGTIDGKGHVLKNFKSSNGLFTILYGATIKNLVITDYENYSYGGLLSTIVWGSTIENVYIEGKHTSEDFKDNQYFCGIARVCRENTFDNFILKLTALGNCPSTSCENSNGVIFTEKNTVSEFYLITNSSLKGAVAATGSYSSVYAFADAIRQNIPEDNAALAYANRRLTFFGTLIYEFEESISVTASNKIVKIGAGKVISEYGIDSAVNEITAVSIGEEVLSSADFTYDSSTGMFTVNTQKTGVQTMLITADGTKYNVSVCIATHVIATKAELIALSTEYKNGADTSKWYVVLTSDIDMSVEGERYDAEDGLFSTGVAFDGTQWDNPSYFYGCIDGQGHSISNITSKYGFITHLSGATLKNLVLNNLKTTSIGGTLGYSVQNTTLENVYIFGAEADATWSDNGYFTGLARLFGGNTIKNVVFQFTDVTGKNPPIICPADGNYNLGGNSVTNFYVISNSSNTSTGGVAGSIIWTAKYSNMDEFAAAFVESIPVGMEKVISYVEGTLKFFDTVLWEATEA